MMAKESTHALEHWINTQARAAAAIALDTPGVGHIHDNEIMNRISMHDLREVSDDLRAAKGDKRHYEIARSRALAIAADLLRVAAICHRGANR